MNIFSIQLHTCCVCVALNLSAHHFMPYHLFMRIFPLIPSILTGSVIYLYKRTDDTNRYIFTSRILCFYTMINTLFRLWIVLFTVNRFMHVFTPSKRYVDAYILRFLLSCNSIQVNFVFVSFSTRFLFFSLGLSFSVALCTFRFSLTYTLAKHKSYGE